MRGGHHEHTQVNHYGDHVLDVVKFLYRVLARHFVMKHCALMHHVAHLD
jgi:hypothetical protein